MTHPNPFSDLVTLQWLFDTRRESLRLLFAPHGSFFRGFVDLNGAQHSHDWKIDAHRALSQRERVPPLDLVVAITQVAELAQPGAHRALLDFAAMHRIDLGANAPLLSPNDVAIHFLRHRPDLFFGTLAERRGARCELSFEGPTRAEGQPALQLTPWRLAKLRSALVELDCDRRRRRYLTVQTAASEGKVSFLLTRGVLSRISRSCVRESLAVRLARPLHFDYDLVCFDLRSTSLEVHARSEESARVLASLLGRVFHRDPEHYRPSRGSAPRRVA